MLVLPRSLLDEMISHCLGRYPKEACGMLAGRDGRVMRAYPMRNVEDSPIGYRMDPKEQLLVEKQMRQRSEQTVAIYHSHTASPAYPSSVDISLAISPDISYVLVSLQDQAQPVVKSYRIDGTRVSEEAVQIEQTPSARV